MKERGLDGLGEGVGKLGEGVGKLGEGVGKLGEGVGKLSEGVGKLGEALPADFGFADEIEEAEEVEEASPAAADAATPPEAEAALGLAFSSDVGGGRTMWLQAPQTTLRQERQWCLRRSSVNDSPHAKHSETASSGCHTPDVGPFSPCEAMRARRMAGECWKSAASSRRAERPTAR